MAPRAPLAGSVMPRMCRHMCVMSSCRRLHGHNPQRSGQSVQDSYAAGQFRTRWSVQAITGHPYMSALVAAAAAHLGFVCASGGAAVVCAASVDQSPVHITVHPHLWHECPAFPPAAFMRVRRAPQGGATRMTGTSMPPVRIGFRCTRPPTAIASSRQCTRRWSLQQRIAA